MSYKFKSTSSNSRVMTLTLQAMSSNPRATKSNPQVKESFDP